jgi:hypothetical protein
MWDKIEHEGFEIWFPSLHTDHRLQPRCGITLRTCVATVPSLTLRGKAHDSMN